MPVDRFLAGRTIALSISETADLPFLGLSASHFRDALTEIGRHLLAEGARLIYGGDLRANGFTEVLFELAYRHASDLAEAQLINPLPWPVHISRPWEELAAKAKSVAPVAHIEFLALDGSPLPDDQRQSMTPHSPSPDEWSEGLTAMRNVVAGRADAYVLLGGQRAGYKGKMPGIAEEALAAIRAGKPVFLLGGFGGCARDVAELIGLRTTNSLTCATDWSGADQFADVRPAHLHCGLNERDICRLAATVHTDEFAALVLRGLRLALTHT